MLRGIDLHMTFGQTRALAGVDLVVERGEVVAVMGPSGCGKSTLLHVLSGVLTPTRDEVWLDGARMDCVGDAQRSRLRLRRLGFVLQFGDLVPELTLRENVELPLRLVGVRYAAAQARAAALIDELGIGAVAQRTVTQVSGGQAQRAAVARALVNDPAVVFADEPTGALDSVAGAAVLSALTTAARQRQAAVLVVTHARDVAGQADRVIHLADGRVDSLSEARS